MLIYWVTKLIILWGDYQDFGSEYIVGGYLFCFGFFRLAIFRYVYKINKAIEIIYISLLSITIFLTGEMLF